MLFADILFDFSAEIGLLADVNRLAEAGRYMERPMSPGVQRMLIFSILGIAAFWGGLFLWDKFRKRIRPTGSPIAELAGELATAHKLSHEDQLLIARVAERLKIDDAAVVFIDPDVLSEYAEQRPADATAAKNLMNRLFGEAILGDEVLNSNRSAEEQSFGDRDQDGTLETEPTLAT
ncbi:hypothetical protein Pan189_16860 [Stratiformator vulcanicus]|uniref:Uncharacterized protein n=2 Tax=Stratiformator vulcanicus TaxID=2527980 RepID=A0A517R0F4_9PLAN|nr:hypothetical protein Pan189_16860 [Stratiformator vulcanicus]